MKNLLHYLYMVTKISVYGMIIQCFLFTALLASEGNAQIKSIKDVTLRMQNQNLRVKQALEAIENETEFHFVYNNKEINNDYVEIGNFSFTVAQVLEDISRQARLSFKQVNNNISVKLIPSETVESDVQVFAQVRQITGKVYDSETNDGLPGVNVIVKGTSQGTITNYNGEYSIEAPSDETILIFSSVGFVSEEVVVGDRSVIDITLSSDITALEEIVVIGYGVEKKSLVTGAISSVKSENIIYSSVSRAEQSLQGRTAGVVVLPNSGAPGVGIKVRVRGAGSSGNANPLYIVDGMKAQDINNLAPDDIASMEVLKDAASSAIYGAEGGNGVIIITTKTGKSEVGKINYSFQYGIQSPGNLAELMNAEQYATYMNEAGLININPADYRGEKGTDWLDEIFDSAPMQKHFLSFSGGTEMNNYHASLSYFDQDGILGGSKANFKRLSGRLNIDNKVNNWLKIGAKINYAHAKRNVIPEDDEFDGLIFGALLIDPITPAYYEGNVPPHVQSLINSDRPLRRNKDGHYFGISQYIQNEAVNPLVRLDINNEEQITNNILGNFYLEVSPFNGLAVTSRIGIDYTHFNDHLWNPTYYYSAERQNTSTSVRDQNYSRNSWLWENFISYNKAIGQHNFTLVAGTSAEQLLYRYLNANAGPMAKEDDLFSEIDFLTTSTGTVDGNLYEEKLMSYFGRFSYDFKNRYMLQATLRYDGASTSLLHPDNNWGSYPSFSAGWILSEEDFWPETFLSTVKIRGSWGQNGSLASLRGVWFDYDDYSPFNGIGHFAYLPAITSANIRYPLPDGSYITGAEPDVLANDELTWETSQQTDFGLDLSAWNGKVTLTVDYFIKKTKDLLAIFDASATAGNDPAFSNLGDVENRGFEFDLGFRNLEGGLKYQFNFNLTTLKNEVTGMNVNIPRIPGMRVGTEWRATAFEVGQPIWYFRGYKTEGIDAETGFPIYTDVNNDGVISEQDQTNIGDPHPDLIYGGNLGLQYKGFDFTLFLQGVTGNEILIGWSRDDLSRSNKPEYFFTDRWTPTNTNASMPQAATESASERQFRYRSDLLISDGSYMRVKQLQLGYNLPKPLLESIKFAQARIYISLDDYFTFSKYKGMDPEAGSSEDSSLGIDRGVYPIPRKLMFGLSVTF